MEVGARVRLLVFAFVVGERACLVPASHSCSGAGSRSALAASTISCNGMAFTTPRICVASSRGRVTWLSSKPSLLQPRDVGDVQRRSNSMTSDKAELPWSGSTFNEAFDGMSDAGNGREEPHTRTDIPAEQQPSAWTSDIWEGDWDEMSASSEDETGAPLPSPGVPGGLRVGSQEFTDLVKAQFDVLATVVNEASRIVLFTRHENAETGGFEFVPALEYPDPENGTQLREGPNDLPSTGNAVDAISDSDIPAVYSTGDQTNYPRTVENDDGSLSAPIMYASVVVGIITMWPEKRNDAKQASDSEGSGDEPLSAGSKAPTKDRTAWNEQDKTVLEKVSSSVAIAAVLDQKQRWAAVMQVKQLREVIAESLHQVKNPMAALRTFGKLLLRRLPPHDTLNRELAKDIILQSDRVVDLLLPIDAVIGLLGQAVDTADTAAIDVAGGGLAGGGTHPQFEGLPAAAPASSTPSVSSIPGGEGVEPFSLVGGEARGAGSLPWSVSQEVQDALLSPSPSEDQTEGREPMGSAASEALPASNSAPLSFVSVQDVIETVAVEAEPNAESRWVRLRWDVGDALPGVLGCATALEEALSIVLEKAIQSCEVVGGRQTTENMGTVLLTARASIEEEWGAHGGVVIAVVGNAGSSKGQETGAGEIPHTLDEGYWDREEVDTVVEERVDLDTAADIMRSCGGVLMVGNKANKDDRERGPEVKLFLPTHRRRF